MPGDDSPAGCYARGVSSVDPGTVPRTLGVIARALFDDAPPVHLGRFEIVRQLGRGGMGVVYLAFDPDLKREVAIKLHARSDDPAGRARLQREAESLAALRHRNVVSVFEVGRTDVGEVFVVMECITGPTLREWIARERPALDRVLEVFARCADGLHASHCAGLVHRDVKPDNVLVDAGGEPRLIDFGLARAPAGGAPGDADDEPSSIEVRDDDAITRDDEVLGTPRYMAPELWTGGRPSPASDQFALCVALYEAIAGAPPFSGRPVGGATRAGAIPRGVWSVLRRGLAADPSARWPSLAEVATRLRGVRRRRAWVPAVVLAGASAAGVIAWGATRAPEAPSDARPRLTVDGDTLAVVPNLLGPQWTWLYNAPFERDGGTLSLDLPVAPWSYRTAQIFDPLMSFQDVAIELEVAAYPTAAEHHEFSLGVENEQYEGMAGLLVFGSGVAFGQLPNASRDARTIDLAQARFLRLEIEDREHRTDIVTFRYSADGVTWTELARGESHVGVGRIVLHLGSQQAVVAEDTVRLAGLYCRDLPR